VQIGNRTQRGLVMNRHIGTLGKHLPEQPDGVLAGPSLPGAVRVAEVHPHAWLTSNKLRDNLQLSVPGLRPKADPMAGKLIPCSLIAASATRSSACISWNLLVICTPYRMGKVLHFRFETARCNRQAR
jgi:hypothetical protein